jgi:hypothetical protein
VRSSTQLAWTTKFAPAASASSAGETSLKVMCDISFHLSFTPLPFMTRFMTNWPYAWLIAFFAIPDTMIFS